jgi:pimeloyl-ACP methyl ester carboxylesterase
MPCVRSSRALGVLIVLLGTAPATDAQSRLSWTRCEEAVPTARCGVLQVPEHREKTDGRQLDIAFTVLGARDRAAFEPVVVLLGGPGAAASGQMWALASVHAAINASRDVILVDQRGTGRSSPLGCIHGSDDDLQSYIDFLPAAAVRACVAGLDGAVDPGRYGTAHFVEDLEALRVALGLRQWSLHGASYGSRVALEYMSRHPRSIRAAVLVGVAPPFQPLPAAFGRDADRALRMLAADCGRDVACAAAFPDFAVEIDSIARRLERAPATVSIPDPVTGSPSAVRFTRAAFGEVVRASMYSPMGAANLPLAVHLAYRGDFVWLARAHVRRQRSIAREGWMGLYLAVTCAEDVPRTDRTTALTESRGTVLGEFRVRQHYAACAMWPAATAVEARKARIATPVLMIVGDRDPVTPPAWARLAQRDMARARLVVIPGGGHGFAGMSGLACLERLQVAFLATLDPMGLDASCATRMRPPRFVVSRP